MNWVKRLTDWYDRLIMRLVLSVLQTLSLTGILNFPEARVFDRVAESLFTLACGYSKLDC